LMTPYIKVAPYYTKAYQEMWVGVGIMTFMYYKLSYGGERSSLLKSSLVVIAHVHRQFCYTIFLRNF
uniref:ATP synthase membrane subunit 6.8PL n=1 Tax=Sinocyclocheilus grahami TaxID=75366 RepID=A0A672PC82_SINGR